MTEVLAKFVDDLVKAQKDSAHVSALLDDVAVLVFADRVTLLSDTAVEIATLNASDDRLVLQLLFQTSTVLDILVKYNNYYLKLVGTTLSTSRDLGAIGASLGKINADVSFHVQRWLLSFMQISDRYWKFKPVVLEVAHLLENILELVTMDRLEEARFLDNCDRLLQTVLDILYDTADVELKYFGVVAKFLATTYYMGQSQLVVRFVDNKRWLPRTGITAVTARVCDFKDLDMFYRYMAFNLVQYRMALNQADPVAPDADPYFKVLLAMPHLSLDLYQQEAPIPEANSDPEALRASATAHWMAHNDRRAYPGNGHQDLGYDDPERNPRAAPRGLKQHPKSRERREIAWLYCVNYLLTVRSIQLVVDGPELFHRELDYFVADLSTYLTNHLSMSSQPSLTHLLVVNVRDLEYHHSSSSQSVGNPLRARLIATITSSGSYKEQLVLVVQFFRYFSDGKLKDLLRRFEDEFGTFSVRFANQPGKQIYLNGLRQIYMRVAWLFARYHSTFLVNAPPLEGLDGDFGLTPRAAPLISHLISIRREIDDMNRIIHRNL